MCSNSEEEPWPQTWDTDQTIVAIVATNQNDHKVQEQSYLIVTYIYKYVFFWFKQQINDW